MHKVLKVLIAFTYASILTFLVPLEAIMDRSNYLEIAAFPLIHLLSGLEIGFKSFITNEPFFLIYNLFLSLFFSADNIVRFTIFVSSFVVANALFSLNKNYLLLFIFFLIVPQVAKNHIIHLRQGLALAFFFLGLVVLSRHRFFGRGLMVLAVFIHSSFLILIIILIAKKTFLNRLSINLKILLVVLFSLILSLLFEPLAFYFGFRQVNHYDFDVTDVSGLAFLFWSSILGLFLIEGRFFLQMNFLPVSILILYLSSYFLIPVSGRIFESGILLVLIAGSQLRDWRRVVFVLSIVTYTFFGLMVSLKYPFLGWGV